MKSNATKENSKRSPKEIIFKLLAFLVMIFLYFLYVKYLQPMFSEEPTTQIPEDSMSVHFMDVGQVDATLFIQDGEVMLFDAAFASKGDELVQYIQNLGIDYIDVLVLSYPHDDHMGGAAEVLNNIEVGKIYGPDIFDIESLDTNDWYSEMLDAINTIDNQRNQGKTGEEHSIIWNLPKDETEMQRRKDKIKLQKILFLKRFRKNEIQ